MENKYKRLEREVQRIRERFPNFVVVTATQPKRGSNDLTPRVPRSGPGIVFIDHIELIK
jgi:hypothetical protein